MDKQLRFDSAAEVLAGLRAESRDWRVRNLAGRHTRAELDLGKRLLHSSSCALTEFDLAWEDLHR